MRRPPFGANGITFNNEGTAMFVNNTAYHWIIGIPVEKSGNPGTPETLATGINAPSSSASARRNVAACPA
jgi:sugar lactone lactonase YvrE